ncbi:Mago nashi domain protein [Aspergillus luchuensis]|uniref:Mago nashi domain protein n=1 Tax=Aspergillus kawachii TaxID=1069201 RepID=A0A146FPZ8_ASPKA|nr:Mago nashi domain protein [Aspergillus luchuensis]
MLALQCGYGPSWIRECRPTPERLSNKHLAVKLTFQKTALCTETPLEDVSRPKRVLVDSKVGRGELELELELEHVGLRTCRVAVSVACYWSLAFPRHHVADLRQQAA